MNIKDVDLNNPDHYIEIPDITITITKHGDIKTDESDHVKMLKWIVNKHRILNSEPLLKFKQEG